MLCLSSFFKVSAAKILLFLTFYIILLIFIIFFDKNIKKIHHNRWIYEFFKSCVYSLCTLQ